MASSSTHRALPEGAQVVSDGDLPKEVRRFLGVRVMQIVPDRRICPSCDQQLHQGKVPVLRGCSRFKTRPQKSAGIERFRRAAA